MLVGNLLLILLLLVIQFLKSLVLLDRQPQLLFVFSDDSALSWYWSEMDRMVLNLADHIKQFLGSTKVHSLGWWVVVFVFQLVVDVLIEHVVFVLHDIHVFEVVRAFYWHVVCFASASFFSIAVVNVLRAFHGSTSL